MDKKLILDQGTNTIHLCVDVQSMFLDGTEWKVQWLPRTMPNICRIAKAHPDQTIFTRFIPAAEPGMGEGMWKPFYMRWAHMTRENLDPRALDVVPDLRRWALHAEIIDKHVYGPWLYTNLHQRLMERGIDTLVITGLETEVCVLATVSGAVDLGYRVIIIRDAVCSSTDLSHDSILDVYDRRYGMQIDIVNTDDLLAVWR